MSLSIIIGLAIIYGLIVWRDSRLALFLFLAGLPAYLLRFDLFGLPMTMLELMFVLLTVGWLIKICLEKNDWLFIRPWLGPFALLILSGIVGVLIAPDKMAGLGILKAYIIEPLIFFLIFQSIIKTKDEVEKALMWLGGGALAVAGFAFFQKITNLSIPIPWDAEGRVTSFFPYPNAVGLYLGPIIILGLGGFWRALQTEFYPRAFFWIVTVGLSTTAIIFSQTEAAWVALPAALIFMGLFFSKQKLFSLILLLIMILPLVFSTTARDKILLRDYSGGVRLKQWEESISMLKDHWLFGAGLSGYPATIETYHTHKEIEIFQYPHNIFLNIWSELGILGLLTAAWLGWVAGQHFFRAKKKSSSAYWLSFVSTTALLAMFIHGLVDAPFFKNDLALLTAIILALLTWSTNQTYAYQNDRENQ